MPSTSVSKATAKAINALHKQLKKEYDSGDFSYSIFCRGMMVGGFHHLHGYMPPTTETPDKIVWTKLHSENPVMISLKGRDAYWTVKNESGETLALTNTYQEAIEWCYKYKCRPIHTSWKVFNKMGYPKE
jgi:hypothetical protein